MFARQLENEQSRTLVIMVVFLKYSADSFVHTNQWIIPLLDKLLS